MRSWLTILVCAGAAANAARAADDYGALVRLAEDWRRFEAPAVHDCLADYGTAAMAAKSGQLAGYRARLHALDTGAWPPARVVDYKLVEAEMNGLDFDLRVRQP